MRTPVERIQSLEQWKDGNGGKGAEERIRDIEKALEKIDRRTLLIIVLVLITIVQSIPDLVKSMLVSMIK